MNVNSIFLDPKTLQETGGCYGVVCENMPTDLMQQRFTEQYINKQMLVDEIQELLNQQAQVICELPTGADEATKASAVWLSTKQLLDQVKAI